MQDYFNAKIKGKSTNKEIFFSVKDDFEKFANHKGGPYMKVYELLDKYIKNNQTEQAEASEKEGDKNAKKDQESEEDDDDFGLNNDDDDNEEVEEDKVKYEVS